MSARSIEPSAFVAKAAEIASFYGFRPVRHIESQLASYGERPPRSARSFDDVASVCVSCMAREKRGPILCFSVHAIPEESRYSPREFAEFSLHLIGASSSLGDIFVMKTTLTILEEMGIRVKEIRLNSTGDKESRGRYEKELSLHVRKRLDVLTPLCRAAAMENPFSLFSCEEDTCRSVVADAPRAITFLSEQSREHLREVLERLDRLDLPYRIDDRLANDLKASRVLFALDVVEHPLVAGVHGGRYDEYFRRLTGRKEGLGVRAGILFRKKGLEHRHIEPKATRAPRIYFVQLGPEAKFKSLQVMELLRRAHIPVYQSFESDKLSPQLEEATRLKVPHLLIMGHKEALEDAVIVRNVANRMQNIVRVSNLSSFLKKQAA